MVKPKKERRVMSPPRFDFFKPAGVPAAKLETVILSIDEYEAIRLVDIENLNHLEASKSMEISRPTFTRLLNSAHKKIGHAIINGFAIRIEGGSFIFVNNIYRCKKCGHEWDLKIDTKDDDFSAEESCPSCDDENIESMEEIFRKHPRSRGRRHGNGHGRRAWSQRQ